MKAKKCMKCGGSMKYKDGGSTSSFAKLAPPYNKATYADKIAGAKKTTMKKGGMVKKGR
jgi:hypothetical protein